MCSTSETIAREICSLAQREWDTAFRAPFDTLPGLADGNGIYSCQNWIPTKSSLVHSF